MFEAKRNRSTSRLIFDLAELTFVASVRKVRQGHRNAVYAIGRNLVQSMLFVGTFYLLFNILGTRGAAIRGDFMLYLLSGIYIYLTHINGLSSVLGSEGPASPMMQHAPMNTIVAILSSALSTLYTQTLSLLIILFVLHTLYNPVVIDQWAPAFMMYILGWYSGCALGMVLLALKPWFPEAVNIIRLVYVRANMIASGKMFVANMLPGYMVAMFDWNPLFHIIDQARGYIFVNYNPHYSNWEYALYFSLAFMMLGLMGEFYTRKRASASWNAGR